MRHGMVLADEGKGFRTLHLFAGAGGASLEICCSDTNASELSKSKATRGRSCLQGRRTEYFHASPSGMMSRLSLGIIRSVQNTSRSYVPSPTGSSSPEDSHARTSPSQDTWIIPEGWKIVTLSNTNNLVKKIHDVCKAHDYCEECPLKSSNTNYCLTLGDPGKWDIDEIIKKLEETE